MAKETKKSELKNITYELFIALLSILSVANIFLYILTPDSDISNILLVIDVPISIIFILDFLYRLFSADSKSQYFFKEYGWLDLLSSIPVPGLKILRVLRIVRVFRVVQKTGGAGIFREFVKARGSSALLTVFLITFLVFEFGGMAILAAEKTNPEANIKNASDALWWIMTTVTTVGYGDTYPTTNPGRIIGVFVMIVGIGLFGTLTGYLANAFLKPQD